jgi:hypothetical protein
VTTIVQTESADIKTAYKLNKENCKMTGPNRFQNTYLIEDEVLSGCLRFSDKMKRIT